MEHIGSFRIMATQQGLAIDFQTLKHLNEETGHAVLFKRHAERLSGSSLDYSRCGPFGARFREGLLWATGSPYGANVWHCQPTIGQFICLCP